MNVDGPASALVRHVGTSRKIPVPDPVGGPHRPQYSADLDLEVRVLLPNAPQSLGGRRIEVQSGASATHARANGVH